MHLPAQLEPGRAEPIGALARDGGVNFVVFSEHAQRIELCIFDTSGVRELKRYALAGPHDGLFCGFLPGVGPGLVYGLRAHGPYEPPAGHRFNPHKLLLDPWAREIVGRLRWQAEHHGYALGHPEGTRSFDARDNAGTALKARVAAPPSDSPGAANAPRVQARDRVLYELHVKGFSQRHPQIPPAQRGCYAALAHPASIAHFKSLGVTTLSLLPVHYHLDEPGLVERGAVNYWGYNTLGFFSPDPRFASVDRHDPTAVADEFRQMVAALHAAGLEVVLDVVYNHTPEGNESGSSVSFRGLDNASWYRLLADDRSHYENASGCGNTLNLAHPRVTQFVLDSLRYWVHEMGVDGFRFDLAPVLGRTRHGFDPNAAFFTALRQDPVLARAVLIAEPWDAGHEGWQTGRFPGRFLEWNDKFRDTVRRYWLTRGSSRGEFARRFTASSDLFHHGQRRPSASVNFITAHDGFTLADLTSYSAKHNQANGEHNRDGRDGEPCANFGAEGPSSDAQIVATRARVRRAMLATLLLAQGTPMLLAGDELGHSQRGNSNAYCQDNDTSWLDWQQADAALTQLVGALTALRRAEPLLHHDDWFATGSNAPEAFTLHWIRPDGHGMQLGDWHDAAHHAFAALLGGGGRRLLLAFNPEPVASAFTLPPGQWMVALDSSAELAPGSAAPRAMPALSLVVLRDLASPAGP